MMSVKYVLFVGLIVLLDGCSSIARVEHTDFYPVGIDDMATLYIYRPKHYATRYAKTPIFKDGELLGVLRNASWLRTAIASGEHVLHTKPNYRYNKKSANIKSSFRGGEVYFLKWSTVSVDNVMLERFSNATDGQLLELIPRHIAASEIVGLDKLEIATIH